ncbi:hypothetical protein ACFL35_00290 [Candidatus Riflebacteria bacterium]
MVIDYSSEVYEKETDVDEFTWNQIPELIESGQIYSAFDVLQKAIDEGKDEVKCRLYVAELLENSPGEHRDFAMDQYEKVLSLEANNVKALAGKARVSAESEIKEEREKEPVREYDEEEDMLKEMSQMAQLAKPKKTQVCLGASIFLWGSGLLMLRRKHGFIYLAYEFLLILLFLIPQNFQNLSKWLWLTGGFSFQKTFQYDLTKFQTTFFSILIIIAIICLILGLFQAFYAVKSHNQTGAIIKSEGQNYFINLGENRKILPGQDFYVFKAGSFKDSSGKDFIQEFPIGRLRIDYIRKLYAKGSFRAFSTDSIQLPAKNDRVTPY